MPNLTPLATVLPRRVRPGATIGVFAPSEPITSSREAFFLRGVSLLEHYGYRVVLSPNCRAVTGFTAGNVQQRVSDFHALLAAHDVDLLMAAWGGKSSAQLLPFLDYDLIGRVRKPICAFSDGGVLLNAIASRTGLVTFYGPNVVGKLHETKHADLGALGHHGYRAGSQVLSGAQVISHSGEIRVEGTVIGGNLSTFTQNLPGTSYEPSPDGAIFIWESGPKTAQELDALLTSLALHGYLHRLAGMVVGCLTVSHDERWGDRNLAALLEDHGVSGRLLVVSAPTFGHGDLENPIIPIGCKATLDAMTGTLALTEAPLAEE